MRQLLLFLTATAVVTAAAAAAAATAAAAFFSSFLFIFVCAPFGCLYSFRIFIAFVLQQLHATLLLLPLSLPLPRYTLTFFSAKYMYSGSGLEKNI